jgi:hypothetical protein
VGEGLTRISTDDTDLKTGTATADIRGLTRMKGLMRIKNGQRQMQIQRQNAGVLRSAQDNRK